MLLMSWLRAHQRLLASVEVIVVRIILRVSLIMVRIITGIIVMIINIIISIIIIIRCGSIMADLCIKIDMFLLTPVVMTGIF